MKKVKYENIVNAAGRHLFKRNCTDSDILKKSKLKLKQTPEQFEKSMCWNHNKIISVQNCSLTEHEADVQYSRLKSWIESLENVYKSEVEDILFPTFISLYRKLNNSGNASGARSFYTRNQSNFFKIPEYRKMAEKFCSEINSHFILEVTQETFDVLNNYVACSDHLFLQHLLNTTVEVNIMKMKLDKDVPFVSPKQIETDSINNVEEIQDLNDIISQMDELPPNPPLLKMFTIDTGQRKMCCASVSPCYRYLSCGFQDSSLTVWNIKSLQSIGKPATSSLDLSCSIGLYHPSSLTSSQSTSAETASTSHSHSGPVYSTQFTPFSTHLLSASEDTTLRLWDLESMEPKVIYRGHTYPVWTTDVFHKGQYFISGSQDRTAKLWTYERTYPLRIFAGHTADIDCVTFHPNGIYVATGSADSSVRMWSVTDGNIVRILVGHRGTVLCVAFSPCGKFLASAGEDHRVKVWDVGTSSIIHDYSGHNDVVHGLCWMSESFLSSYSADGNVRVWNTKQPVNTAVCNNPSVDNFASFAVPPTWKPVYLGKGHRQSLICVGASD